jgi:hypothetical protein
MRVLHIVSGPGTFAMDLSRQERALGLISNVLTTAPDQPSDVALRNAGADVGGRIRAGLQAPLDYDVLHYHGPTLFDWDDLRSASPHRFLDLKVAKAMGRRIIFTLDQKPDEVMTETIMPLYADRVFSLVPGDGKRLPYPEVGIIAIAQAMLRIYADPEAPLILA